LEPLTPEELRQQEIDLRMGRMLYKWRRAVHLDIITASHLSGIPTIRIAALEKGKARIPIRRSECVNFSYAYGVSAVVIEQIALGENPGAEPTK